MSRREAKENAAKGRAKRRAAASASDALSLATHPRAAVQIGRAKGWGGLTGFAVALLVSASAGISAVELAWALAVGVAGVLIAWAGAVALWRQLAAAELERAREAVEERRRELAGVAEGADGAPPARTDTAPPFPLGAS